MNHLIKTGLLGLALSLGHIGASQAWWGGPGGGSYGPFNGNGFGDFNMSMRGNGRGNGYGQQYGQPYYGGYGAPYGYGAPGGYGSPR